MKLFLLTSLVNYNFQGQHQDDQKIDEKFGGVVKCRMQPSRTTPSRTTLSRIVL
jgi:hypothetical protein